MTAAVFLWGGLALIVAAVWLLLGTTGGAAALGVYGVAAAVSGAAAMREVGRGAEEAT